MTNLRQFPIAGYFSRPKWKYINGTSIPWEMIAPHEKQAMANHCGQSLERLAQRGGLGACEALAVLEDRNWAPMDDDEAYGRIEALAKT